MYVLICTRVVKINTGATEKFSPRTANHRDEYVSGPFGSLKAAGAAMQAALATHTCLSAQVWSEAQVAEHHARGYGRNGNDKQNLMDAAVRLFEAARPTEVSQ